MRQKPLTLPPWRFTTPVDGGFDFDGFIQTEPTVGWFEPYDWTGKVITSTNYRRLPILYHDGWNAGAQTTDGGPNTPDDDFNVFDYAPLLPTTFPNYPGFEWGKKGTLIRVPNAIVIDRRVGQTNMVYTIIKHQILDILEALRPRLVAKSVGFFIQNFRDNYLTDFLPIDSASGDVNNRTIVVAPEKFIAGNVLYLALGLSGDVAAGAIQFMNYVNVTGPSGSVLVQTRYPMLAAHAALVAACLPRFESFQCEQFMLVDDITTPNPIARWTAFQPEIPTIQGHLDQANMTLRPWFFSDDPGPLVSGIISDWLDGLP